MFFLQQHIHATLLGALDFISCGKRGCCNVVTIMILYYIYLYCIILLIIIIST